MTAIGKTTGAERGFLRPFDFLLLVVFLLVLLFIAAVLLFCLLLRRRILLEGLPLLARQQAQDRVQFHLLRRGDFLVQFASLLRQLVELRLVLLADGADLFLLLIGELDALEAGRQTAAVLFLLRLLVA